MHLFSGLSYNSMHFLRAGVMLYSPPQSSHSLALGTVFRWTGKGLHWLVIKMVPVLEAEKMLWERTVSSLCPRAARHDIVS